MSAGHPAPPHNHNAVAKEVRALLAAPEIKRYLARSFTVDATRKVPLTGGSSIDGRVYYVDPDVPAELRKYVIWHERVEKAIRAVRGETYPRAHLLATTAERLLVEHDGKSWAAYKPQVARPVRANEARGVESLPAKFDLGPYRESGEMRLVAQKDGRGVAARIAKSEVAYTDHGTRAEHCSICEHFRYPAACEIVAGRIGSYGWCKRFKKRFS